MAEAVRKIVYSNNVNQTAKINVHNKKSNAKKYIKRRNIFLKIIYTSFMMISIASAIFILTNYEKITSLNFEIRQVDAIILEAEKTEMNLQAKIEKVKSGKDIVDEAQTKLGMIYPERDQVVYFTLEDTEIESKNENMLSTIFSTITGIKDN